MKHIKVEYYPENRVGSDFEPIIKDFKSDPDIKSVMLLMTEGCEVEGFLDIFNRNQMDVFGGLFPGIILNQKKFGAGVLMVGLTSEADIRVLNNIDESGYDFERHLTPTLIEDGYSTVLVLVDGFAKNISVLIEELFNLYGIELNFIGGGAGSLKQRDKYCLFSNEGLFSEGAIIIALKSVSSIAVKHGWELLNGPIKVSLSDRNDVKVLNNKPALKFYKDIIEKDSGVVIKDDVFFDKAKAYPFGLSKLGSEYIVRDPILATPEESIICVGDVPQNSLINILKGDKNKLVSAAKEAVVYARENFPVGIQPQVSFVVDCISRVLFLNEKFDEELASLTSTGLPTIGVLSIGEIANSGKDYLEFYNKTCVVSLINRL